MRESFIKNKNLPVSNGVDNSNDFDIKIDIIFENEDFLVINKPAGLVVHPVKSFQEKTLVSYLLKHYPDVGNVGDPSARASTELSRMSSGQINLRPGIVHRLDKEVSGLMIMAKTQKVFNYFKNEFQNHRIDKEYLALVYGQPKNDQGTITLALTRGKNGKTIVAKSIALNKIKEAWTEYKVLEKFKNFALLKVRIKTGRTHQIRIHLKNIGHPIVGDNKYKIKRQKKVDLAGRIFLHSHKLGFYDLDGKRREFQSDLPKELENFLRTL